MELSTDLCKIIGTADWKWISERRVGMVLSISLRQLVKQEEKKETRSKDILSNTYMD